MEKTYSKTHNSKKAAAGHVKNIEKRGGKIDRERMFESGKTEIKYEFPKSKKKK